MNKYNETGTHIIDATGKEWPCNVAHPLPLPKGIKDDGCNRIAEILFGLPGSSQWYGWDQSSDVNCWLARHPLPPVPPVPKPKTQEELDMEAAKKLIERLKLALQLHMRAAHPGCKLIDWEVNR